MSCAKHFTSHLLPIALLLCVPLGSVAQTSAPTVQVKTPYTIGAQRSGVVKCLPRINQVTSFVIGPNANSGMVLNSTTGGVDQRLVSTLIEIEGNGITSFVSGSFAPGATGSECSGTYDAVTYWPGSCAQVASNNFAAFKATRPLLKNINTLDGGPFVKVFLMPAGTGCVSIKKEILY